MGNVKQNFKRSCLNLGMVIAIVVPLGIFFVSLYDGGILGRTMDMIYCLLMQHRWLYQIMFSLHAFSLFCHLHFRFVKIKTWLFAIYPFAIE